MPVSQILQASLASGVPSSVARSALPTGSVLQVVSATSSTITITSSTSYVDCTGITASITPTSATSKILVLITAAGIYKGTNSGQAVSLRVLRGASVITSQINIAYSTTAIDFVAETGFVYLDSPATTSSTTYKLQIKARVSGAVQINQDNSADISTVTLMEIAA